MWKHFWSLTAIVFSVHCGGATQSAAPPETADGDEHQQEPVSPTEDETYEESGSETGSEAGSAQPEPAAKKQCAELDKSTCKVTVGCAWNEVQKCIEHASAE
jgi:hypothetical protein